MMYNIHRFSLVVAVLATLSSCAKPPVPGTSLSPSISSGLIGTINWGDTARTQVAANYFSKMLNQPPYLTAFLEAMPKGADLHIHLSGAIYAETYINWAAEDQRCVNTKNWEVSPGPCGDGEQLVSEAFKNNVLYRKILEQWSMHNWQLSGNSGHDHFFDTFGKFSRAKDDRDGDMLAKVTQRAAKENLVYLELMMTFSSGEMRDLGMQVGLDGGFESARQGIADRGLGELLTSSQQLLNEAEARQRELLKCGTPEAEPGCDVVVRYIHQVNRLRSPEKIFADMLVGFELMRLDPRVVGLNMVAPEDNSRALKDYTLHMQMLEYLGREYPEGNVTLHAGELTTGLVPPEDLDFHIREAVDIAKAKRIGHGVDVMSEDKPFRLLDMMAERKVMVEICLTSNDVILGIRGRRHPLRLYMKHDVPVALATDDLGVARSSMMQEYQKGVDDQALNYIELKTMARASLEYAFVEGDSLWKDIESLVPIEGCADDAPGVKAISRVCQDHLDNNLKAQLQWKLEEQFRAFEGSCCSR